MTSQKIFELMEMLKWKRPANTASEEEFVTRFIDPLPNSRRDDFGNVIVDVGEPKILFSSHTDTAENEEGFRNVVYDELINVMTSDGNSILGADDGAGMFLMIRMIECGIPGRYVFHRCEEIGAHGSIWIEENTPEILDGMVAAIAFDRSGDTDVVTKMVTGVTCTGEFANVLSEMLSEYHKGCDGVFTDTAFYIDHIPNCTNVSVGYYNEHTTAEFLDLDYFCWLYDRVSEVQWEKLI